MIEQRYGKPLEDLVQELVGNREPVKGATAHVEHWGRLTPMLSEASRISGMTRTLTSAPFRRRAGASDDSDRAPDIVVAASGNLAHISFPGIPGRANRSTIDAAYPDLIDGLVRHPGIGLVMVREGDDAAVVLGARGSRGLADDRSEGSDPIASFGRTAAEGLRRVDAMAECGDLV